MSIYFCHFPLILCHEILNIIFIMTDSVKNQITIVSRVTHKIPPLPKETIPLVFFVSLTNEHPVLSSDILKSTPHHLLYYKLSGIC